MLLALAAAALLCAPLSASAYTFGVYGETTYANASLEYAYRVSFATAPVQATRFGISCTFSDHAAVTAEATWTVGQVDATGYRRVPLTFPAIGEWTCTYVFENIVQGGPNTPSTQYPGGTVVAEVMGQVMNVVWDGDSDSAVGSTYIMVAYASHNPIVATDVDVNCKLLPSGQSHYIKTFHVVGTDPAYVNFIPTTFGTWSCKFEMYDVGTISPSSQYDTVDFLIDVRGAPSGVTFPTSVLIGSSVAIDLTPGPVPDKHTDISIVCTGTPFGANAPVVKTAAPAVAWDAADNQATQHTSVTFDQVAQYTCVISFTTGSAPNVVPSLLWTPQTVIVTAHKPLIYLDSDAGAELNHPLNLYVYRDAAGATDLVIKISCGLDGARATALTPLEFVASATTYENLPTTDYTPTRPGHFTCVYQIFNSDATTLNTVYGVADEASVGSGIGRFQFSIAGTEGVTGAAVRQGVWSATQYNSWQYDQIMLGDVVEYDITLSNDPSTVGPTGLDLTVSANCGGYATVTSPAVWSAFEDGYTATLQLTIDGTGGHQANFLCSFTFSGTAADFFIDGPDTLNGAPALRQFEVNVVPSITVEHTPSATGSVLPSSAQSVHLRLGKDLDNGYSLHIAMACDYYIADDRTVVAISGADLLITGPGAALSTEATFTVAPAVSDVRCTFTRGAGAGGVGSSEWVRMPEYIVLVRTAGAGVLTVDGVPASGEFSSRGSFGHAITVTLPEIVNALGLHLNLTCTGLDVLSIDFAAGALYNTLQFLTVPVPTRQTTDCSWSIAGDDYFALPNPTSFQFKLPAISLTGVTAQSKFLFGNSHVFTFTTNALNQYAGDDFSIDVECTKGNSGNSGIVAGLAAAGTKVSFTYIAPNTTAGSPDTTDSCTFTVVSEAHFTPFFVDAAPEAITFGLTLTPPVVPQSSSSSSSSTGPHPPSSSSSSSSSSGPPPPPPSSSSSGPSSSSSGPSAPPPLSSSGPSSSLSGASAPPPPPTNGTTLSSSSSSSGGNGGNTTIPGDFTNIAAGVQSASVLAVILALVVAVFGAAL